MVNLPLLTSLEARLWVILGWSFVFSSSVSSYLGDLLDPDYCSVLLFSISRFQFGW